MVTHHGGFQGKVLASMFVCDYVPRLGDHVNIVRLKLLGVLPLHFQRVYTGGSLTVRVLNALEGVLMRSMTSSPMWRVCTL